MWISYKKCSFFSELMTWLIQVGGAWIIGFVRQVFERFWRWRGVTPPVFFDSETTDITFGNPRYAKMWMATKKSSLSTWFCLLLTVDVDGGFVVVVVHRKIGIGHYFSRVPAGSLFNFSEVFFFKISRLFSDPLFKP